MHDLHTPVAEWLECYSDTGIMPAVSMLGICVFVSILLLAHRALDAHEKDVFIKVLGTPALLAALHFGYALLYEQERTTQKSPFEHFKRCVVFCVDFVQGVVALPSIVNQFASDILQLILFMLGVSLVLQNAPVTEAYIAKGRGGAGKLKFAKRWMFILVIVTYFVMPCATYMAFVAYVAIKYLGIIQVIHGMNWLNSTERTSTTPKAKAEKNKKNPEVFTLCKSTKAQTIWNAISDKEGMKEMNYEDITRECKNNGERQNALLPHVQKFFTVIDNREA